MCVVALLVVAYVVVPLVANEYWLQAILIPFLISSLAALGLNLLTGYAGQVSLGTGGFMAVGAYTAYKMTTAFPELNILLIFLLSGLVAAAIGLVFGIPSLRIKGLYLAVATLAAQFFLMWLFNRVAWFYNYNPSGTITAPPRTFLGLMVTGPGYGCRTLPRGSQLRRSLCFHCQKPGAGTGWPDLDGHPRYGRGR